MIEYKLKKIQMTGNVCPQQVNSMSFSKDDLKAVVSQRYGAVANAVIDEVFRVLTQKIGEGRTVCMNDFGTFNLRLGMRRSNVTEYEDVRSQDITVDGVRFNAAKELRKSYSNQGFHLMDGDKVIREKTTDDRWVVLYNYILEQYNEHATPFNEIYISVSTYKHLAGCTDYTARQELELFCKEGKMRELHVGKNKAYVLMK